MTDNKKKRMSILDSLASAGAPAPTTSMMSSNRALRSARDAVDAHSVWELDPALIEDTRLADRLDPADVYDLRDAIEANGQAVPILVRRHPSQPDRYLLVYGRRRLEAIRQSDKVTKVRALVASLDDDTALRTQISENMARRDLSFIEKALFAQELIQGEFGTQSQVAEVLTVTKSSISMALAIADTIGRDLIRAIGAAHGVGRPRWDALARSIEATGADRARLIDLAQEVYAKAEMAMVVEGTVADDQDLSLAAFEVVVKAVERAAPPKPAAPRSTSPARPLTLAGRAAGSVRRSPGGLRIDIDNGPFTDWVETRADTIIQELHDRWLQRAED